MSKSFREFLSYYKFSSSNNFLVFEDFIIYDILSPSFIDYPLTPYNSSFRKFFKYSLKKGSLKNLLSLFNFKYQKKTKISVFKDNNVFCFVNPYKERSRIISYPIDNDFNFFLTITFRNPFKSSDFDILRTISFNDYLNEITKKGFKRMRDYLRRHYQLQLKKELYNMSIAELEELFGFVPSSDDLENYIKSEVKSFMGKNYKYFRVYEVHKSGVIHIHSLVKFPKFFTDMNFKDMIEKIASWFQTEPNGVQLDRISRNKKGSSGVKGYILKYMNKQFQNDNLFFIENENKENIFLLRTSSFIVNFINRLSSYSRNVKRKKFKPFSEFSKEQSDKHFDIIHRDVELLDFPIEKKEYQDYKLFLDRFVPISKKRLSSYIDNQVRIGQAVFTLENFLEDRYFSIEGIQKSLDILCFNEDFQVLFTQSLNKFNQLLNDLDSEDNDYIDF